MQRFLLLLIILLFFSNTSMAQNFNTKTTTDQLHLKGFLSDQEKNQLIQSSQTPFFGEHLKASFLYSLGDVYLKHRYLPDNLKSVNVPLAAIIGMGDLLKVDSSEINQDAPSPLNKQLLKMDLINLELYHKWLEKTKTEKILKNDAAMLLFYSAQTLEIEDRNHKKKEVLVLIEKCKQHNILTEDFEKNASSYLPNINEAVDLVAHMDHGVTIGLGTLPKNPKEGYTEIFQRIDESFNELSIRLEDFNLTKIEEEDSKKALANIQLSTNQEIYTDTFYYSPYGHKWRFDDINITKFSDKIIDIVNEILFQNNSVYKFYVIQSYSNSYNKNKAGYAFLTKDRYQKIKKTFPEFRILGPHPTKNLTPKMVEIYEKEFMEMGLIKTSTQPEIRDSIHEFNDFFSHYNITQKISFLINEQRNHTTVLQEIGDIIGEEFQITPIAEVWDTTNASIHLEFLLNGKKEEMNLTIYERKNDRVFFDRKKELLQEANLSKKFVFLNLQTASLGYGYFTESQIEWIKLNGDWIYTLIYNE